MLAVLLFVASNLQSIAYQYQFHITFRIGLQVRSAIVAMVYRKVSHCVVDHIKEFLLFRKKIFLLVQNFNIGSNKVDFIMISKNFLRHFYQQVLCQVGRAREN